MSNRLEYFKKLYRDRRAAGLCGANGCSNGAVENRTLCWKHTVANRRSQRQRRVGERSMQRAARKRERLPQDRAGVTLKFTIMHRDEDDQGVVVVREAEGYLQTGEYADGRLGEVFVKMGKSGHSEAVLDEWAKASSLALQSGAGVEELFGKHVGTRFAPSGAVIGVHDIKTCTSVLDLIARWLIRGYAQKEAGV